ncbi:procathepsin L-like isoform X2 [Argiope bruennichi]|uniref:Cathepsin S like protein n=1 Tax=Argiope bruennichi TaxID=94029 RepID=A0A8T0G0N2_ARGBR|nr:procathepsin L-like isoform X2 [Argiope bruennichi]KAF8796075.1 Cathepsin S like protein [Argiope bruennichi]
MKALIFFVVFHVATGQLLPKHEELDKQWTLFKIRFGKSYENEEEKLRRTIWQHTLRDIAQHNIEADLGMHSYRMGINQFSDRVPQELVGNAGEFFSKRNPRIGPYWKYNPFHDDPVPETLDWRDAGLVTPVKNQEPCGACWAFSATGSLEGQHKKKTGQLVSLSEQNLVDCSTENNGCNGGDVNAAFEYVVKNGGIDTESSYPYTATNGTCHFNNKNIGATCSGYMNIPEGDEEALKKAVATVGPISVIIDACHNTFINYRSGIFDEPKCRTDIPSHAVLVIGYGTEDGKDYWLVKNSYLLTEFWLY